MCFFGESVFISFPYKGNENSRIAIGCTPGKFLSFKKWLKIRRKVQMEEDNVLLTALFGFRRRYLCYEITWSNGGIRGSQFREVPLRSSHADVKATTRSGNSFTF